MPTEKNSQNQSTKCQLCHKNFNQSTLLKMHMKAFHGFKCKFCPQAFYDAKTLKNHAYHIHLIDQNADLAMVRYQDREWHNMVSNFFGLHEGQTAENFRHLSNNFSFCIQ